MDVHPTRWSDVMTLISKGEISDGKTLAALLYLRCVTQVGRPGR
jgi:hypothetical protein